MKHSHVFIPDTSTHRCVCIVSVNDNHGDVIRLSLHTSLVSCCSTWSLTTWLISLPPLMSSACSLSSSRKPTSTSSLNQRNSASELFTICPFFFFFFLPSDISISLCDSSSSLWCLLVVKCVAALNGKPSCFLLSSFPVSRLRPRLFLRDVRLLILEHSRWSMVEKYQALTAGLTSAELMEFSQNFRAELYAEGLVQGNFSSAVSGRQTACRQVDWLKMNLADYLMNRLMLMLCTRINWFWVCLTLFLCLSDFRSSPSLSYLYLIIMLYCVFLHRSQNSSCSISQSKSALTLNALPNENTSTIQSNLFAFHTQ